MSDEETPRLRAVPESEAVEGALARQPEHDESWDGVVQPSQRGGTARFITDVIVDLGLAAPERVHESIEAARVSDTTPEQVLLAGGAINQDGLARALAERYGLDYIDLNVFKVDMAAANLLPMAAARRYQAVPVAFVDERTLLVGMADPANVRAVDDIAIVTGHKVRQAVAAPDDIAVLIGRLDRLDDIIGDLDADDQPAEVVELRESADDAPVVRLVNQIIAQAVEQRASDIHLAPDGQELRVRLRVDGVLQDASAVPRRMARGVISRIKIMCDLDIAERRMPQDGRLGMTVDGHHVDLRIVTLPSVHGESLVMRILDKDSVVMELDKLGMGDDDRERFVHSFGQAYGAVLATGPTGSGKSTSLYAALLELNQPETNIVTIEDPVEYQIEGITQVQVSPRVGLTFATGLRSMMRADPDVIMVGEIRDRETAQIAIEAALTGHMVLSTLHTNDAPTAITRLIEMGVEPFLVASAIDCVVAQRLARTLCANCKRRTILSADVLRDNGFPSQFDIEAYEPVGCKRCSNSGYRGRVGLFEVMLVTPEISKLAIERRPADEVLEVAVAQGMRRLEEDGFEKVKLGRTSITEVARVVGTA